LKRTGKKGTSKRYLLVLLLLLSHLLKLSLKIHFKFNLALPLWTTISAYSIELAIVPSNGQGQRRCRLNFSFPFFSNNKTIQFSFIFPNLAFPGIHPFLFVVVPLLNLLNSLNKLE
jgi:hypothetical protein